eukprot:1950954-Pyramimonas_sp.AAC.1
MGAFCSSENHRTNHGHSTNLSRLPSASAQASAGFAGLNPAGSAAAAAAEGLPASSSESSTP